MTEKRFQYIRGKYSHGVHDTVKDGEYKKGYRTTYDEFDLDKLTDELNIRENRIKQLEKENEQLKQQNDFLTTQLAELSTYMMALGYDIELEFEDGRVIKLNEELKGDVE